jgi:hypothetical protein
MFCGSDWQEVQSINDYCEDHLSKVQKEAYKLSVLKAHPITGILEPQVDKDDGHG